MNTQFNRCNKPNSALNSIETINYCQLNKTAQLFLEKAAKHLNLSARAYFKTLRVARTIADLEGSETITKNQLAEALNYRLAFPYAI